MNPLSRKPTYRRKTSTSLTSSSSQPISCSTIEGSSIREATNDEESMRRSPLTKSIVPFEKPSLNPNAKQRQQLDLITKYTSMSQSIDKYDQRAVSPILDLTSSSSDNKTITGGRNKRSSSSFHDLDPRRDESKRAKVANSIEEVQDQPANSNTNKIDNRNGDDHEDEELLELLDHRSARRMYLNMSQKGSHSQIQSSISTVSSIVRKPTVRKSSINQRHAAASPPIIFSQPILSSSGNHFNGFDIILDGDSDDATTHQHDVIPLSPNRLQQKSSPKRNHSNLPSSSSSTPAKSLSNSSLDSPILRKTPLNHVSTPIIPSTKNNNHHHSSFHVSLKINAISPNNSSPEKSERENRCSSSISSASLMYDTPSSSLSRTTTTATTISQTTPISSPIRKLDVTTDTNDSLVKEMIVALIEQCGLNSVHHQYNIDYDPKELSKELFQQCSLMMKSNQECLSLKHQNLRFGKFEMDVVYPIDQDKIETIYACDRCLKHFYGSSFASQRHTSKCHLTRPPGQLVFDQNDLAIFQIGEENMTIQQRLYIESLHRISRLFDTSKPTNSNHTVYYILCRRDPLFSPLQPCVYRFIGYFSRSFDPSACKSIDNFSCLFILPPYAHHSEYNQLLITYSYFLIQSQLLTENSFSSPERPMTRMSLVACEKYWCKKILHQLSKQTDQSISLETLARQIFLHPRDILFSLYFNRFIRSHPTDTSIIYVLKSASDHLGAIAPPKNFIFQSKWIRRDENYRNNDDKQIEEIVLD